MNKQDDLWISIFSLILLEFFGQELYEQWLAYIPEYAPPGPDELVFDVDLAEWEKRMFTITDVLHRHLAINHGRMIESDIHETDRIADALRELFWAFLHFKYDRLKGESIGIRAGWKVVRPSETNRKGGVLVGPIDIGKGAPKELIQSLKSLLDHLKNEGEE